MLWAYVSFSQWLVVWMGNLPEEARWYVQRLIYGGAWIGLALILFHFALPFALLLSRTTKENLRRLRTVAIILLVMRWLDLRWLIGTRVAAATAVEQAAVPGSSQTVTHDVPVAGLPGSLSWMDLVAPLTV